LVFNLDDASFPSESVELHGYFVGIAPNYGHHITFNVLTDETQKVRHYSALQYADDPKGPNLSLTDFFDGVPTSVEGIN